MWEADPGLEIDCALPELAVEEGQAFSSKVQLIKLEDQPAFEFTLKTVKNQNINSLIETI